MEQGQLGCDACIMICISVVGQVALLNLSRLMGYSWRNQAKAWSVRESWGLTLVSCAPMYFQYLPRNTESDSINIFGKIWIDEWIWQGYQVRIPSLMGKARMEIRCCTKSLWGHQRWSFIVPGFRWIKSDIMLENRNRRKPRVCWVCDSSHPP